DDGNVPDRDAALATETARQQQALLASLQTLNNPPSTPEEAMELLRLIQALRQILDIHDNYVAGYHLQNTPGASKMSGVMLHALLWNIQIFDGIIPSIEKKQILLIDSDVPLDTTTYPIRAIVAFQNTQGNT